MTSTLTRASSTLVCPPRWGTPRTESRDTYGPRIALAAATFGQPLMEWQLHVSDVSGEIDPETGLLAYRNVVLLTPRQSGKTTEILAVSTARANMWPAQRIVYTAQTRIAARQKWEDEHIPILEESPLKPLFRVRKTTGNEAIIWKNHSTHGLTSATKKSGHGPTLDVAFLDEAFAHTDDRLEQAFRPAMITRPQPQLWIVSTAGTIESTYLKSKVKAGRKQLEAGTPSSTAYFEWSAPDDADPLALETWLGCMPALERPVPGFRSTITEAAIRAELQSMLDEHGVDGLDLFRRAYLNQWPDGMPVGWHVIGSAAWKARAGASGRPAGRVAFGLSAAWPDAEWGTIAVVGRHGAEVFAQIVEYRPGTSWMPARAAELRETWLPVATVLDDKDPAYLREKVALEAAKVPLTSMNMTQAGQAFGMMLAAIQGDDPYLRHYDQPELTNAVAGADKRPIGDAFTWARQGAADIGPVSAITAGLYGLLVNEGKITAPADIF
jgi:hypothetical protein